MEKDKKFASLFGNNPDISIEEKDRVIKELQKIGSLTFIIETHEEGWLATCKEIAGLIASGTNTKPSQSEIESEIREAVYAAFNVKFEKIPTPLKFEYNFEYNRIS